jgi:flagellin
MMMSLHYVNTNLNAIRALQTLRNNTERSNKAGQQLASGVKVSKPSDDPSAYAIAQRMSNDILQSQRITQNIQDGMGMLDVAESALSTVTDNLQRIRELGIAMASDTFSVNERSVMAQEIRTIVEDINRLASSTTFNGVPLLNGSTTEAKVQIGTGSNVANNTLDLATGFAATDGFSLGIYGVTHSPPRWSASGLNAIYNAGTTDIDTADKALLFVGDIDTAIKRVHVQRSQIGAMSNQLERLSDFTDLYSTTVQSAKSRLIDTDTAKLSAEYTQSQVLQNAAVSILSQANSSNQSVLRLLER